MSSVSFRVEVDKTHGEPVAEGDGRVVNSLIYHSCLSSTVFSCVRVVGPRCCFYIHFSPLDATAFPAYLTGADAVRAGGHSDAKVMVKQMELCISRIVLGVRDSVNRSTGQPLDCPPIYVPNI